LLVFDPPGIIVVGNGIHRSGALLQRHSRQERVKANGLKHEVAASMIFIARAVKKRIAVFNHNANRSLCSECY